MSLGKDPLYRLDAQRGTVLEGGLVAERQNQEKSHCKLLLNPMTTGSSTRSPAGGPSVVLLGCCFVLVEY